MSKMDKNWKNKATREMLEFADDILLEGHRIPVAEVVLGDKIITSWSRTGRIKTTSQVTSRFPCPGHNGMHVHINKSNCFDSRAYVYVSR